MVHLERLLLAGDERLALDRTRRPADLALRAASCSRGYALSEQTGQVLG